MAEGGIKKMKAADGESSYSFWAFYYEKIYL